MSDEPREAQRKMEKVFPCNEIWFDDEPPRKRRRKMERIFLCNEIWFDCLPFLSRAKVGFEFALVSDRFDGLADAHLNSKKRPWTLGNLWIRRITDQNEAIVFNFITKKCLPFPEESLPENVIGFKSISIRYIDHKVIDFLRRIRRLFQPKNNGNDDGIGLRLSINSQEVRSLAIFIDSIWPLINPSATTNLVFWNNTFDEFRQRISSTFLLNWTNVRMLSTEFDVSFGNGENGQLLRQWLFTPREDGKPKLLMSYCLNLQTVEHLKTEFLSAQSAVSFIIAFFKDVNYNVLELFVPFELDNWCTGERLTFRKVRNIDDDDCWLLERGPIGGRDAEKWAKWEREVINKELEKYNVLTFWLGDNNIGSLNKIAGPSGQKLRK